MMLGFRFLSQLGCGCQNYHLVHSLSFIPDKGNDPTWVYLPNMYREKTEKETDEVENIP